MIQVVVASCISSITIYVRGNNLIYSDILRSLKVITSIFTCQKEIFFYYLYTYVLFLGSLFFPPFSPLLLLSALLLTFPFRVRFLLYDCFVFACLVTFSALVWCFRWCDRTFSVVKAVCGSRHWGIMMFLAS